LFDSTVKEEEVI